MLKQIVCDKEFKYSRKIVISKLLVRRSSGDKRRNEGKIKLIVL